MHEPLPKDTTVIVQTTNGGETWARLVHDYVPTYAIWLRLIRLDGGDGHQFSIPAGRLKSVRRAPTGIRYRVTRIDRAASDQVSCLQIVYAAADPFALCADDQGVDGIERVAVSLVEGGPYFTIPREDVEQL